MATVGGHIFSVNLSPICCRDTTSSSDKQKRNPISKRQAVSTDKTSAARTVKTKTTSSTRSLVEKKKTSDQEEATATTAKSKTTSARSSYETIHQLQQAEESCCNNRKNLKDYFVEAKVMIRSDGGPPRWFSPLDCGSHASDSPRLLFLPGIDGLGLGLIRQHQRLGKIFEVWCLHIPVKNRTSFTGLVKLIETTIRSEHKSSPKRPIYLVGESLGACLALAVAARNPHIDLVLILANSATSFNQSALQSIIPLLELMPGQITLTMSAILSLMTGNPLKMAMANAVKGLSVQPMIQDLSQDLAAMPSYLPVLAEILPKETLLWKLELLKAASAYANARLDAVKAQTLILSSGKDQLLPSREEGQRLSSVLPKCQLRSFDDHGHFLFLEDGIDLATIIKGASYYRRGRILDDVSDFLPPTTTEFNKLNEENRWLSVLTSPVMLSTLEDGKIVRGLSGIPSEGPVLLVGYHNFLGLEVFSMIPQFLIERNILLRGLAHPIMFFDSKDGGLPELGPYDKFRIMGAVPVSAANFYKLMSSKSHVLLYPGGMREAMHRKGEEYKLFWPETSEFVRMAATFGATIIPFGAVGEDDITQILIDYDDQVKIPFMKSQIEAWTEKFVTVRTGSEGEVGNQPLHMVYYVPKVPGRYYYYFGKPIETKGRKQELRDKKKAQELYIEIKSEVENCIAYLKEKRESDPYRNIMTRLIYQATNGFGFASQVPTFEL